MQNNVLLGISLMVVTTFMFSTMDGVSRYLAENNNVFTLVTMRYWFIALVMAITCLFVKNSFQKILYTKQPFTQFSRGMILSLNNCLVVYTFTLLGLVETHAIIACYPLIVAGLSVPFLGEKFGWRRWTAIFVGFVGVIIILRPTTNVISDGAIYALVGAIMFAVYLILTRYVSRLDSAITSFFWAGIGGTVTMTIISFFIWEDILREDFLWLLIMCLLSASSHFMMVKTLQVAEASVIQPFSYLQLVFGSIIGVTVFSESIDLMIVIGAIIVIGSGLFTAWREYIKKNIQHNK
ncbi:MAG: DMT family transporter [Candidatus Puniceispirillales bacterium]|jgi:drug/metabolite transporter (DMT)-like permease|nr:DMT family transporter [Alphaproteobacteria bacterium]MBL6850465.1 DMT family transporter [Alphaproteobacteria bacterium]